jgi:hypothetical protein
MPSSAIRERGCREAVGNTGMETGTLVVLNWYVYLFRVRKAKERWPEIARVVRHLLMIDS